MTIDEWDAFVKKQLDSHPIAALEILKANKDIKDEYTRLCDASVSQSYIPNKAIKPQVEIQAKTGIAAEALKEKIKVAYLDQELELPSEYADVAEEKQAKVKQVGLANTGLEVEPSINEQESSNSGKEHGASEKEKQKQELLEKFAKNRDEITRNSRDSFGW